ncbi:alpha/beta fold hydrolase [Methylobacterium sp. J-068]|uniref:alpha/beta fold hydrolase n=1 Tax=Methylobacterium sp. J-068 TaxID=2836649 RepID=UPI001FBA5DB1|nr:alpha/beta fold hydrolase [Methylobacterium sp. J-068]MCJ2036959.1 alpha/beta fold hydrolase [Methylobacterium sp. J-068]
MTTREPERSPGTGGLERAPEGVLLLHGMARRASSFAPMERACREAGFATLNLDYPSRVAALEDLVDVVAPRAAAFAEGTRALHVVTHSMGGLLARAWLRAHRPARLGRVVMLGPPNGGSEIADRLHTLWAYRRFFGPAGAQLTTRRDDGLRALLGRVDYPLGIIAGDRSLYPLESWLMLPGANDGRVTVQRTRVCGMTDHVTLHASHGLMMRNPRVIDETLRFLRTGAFSRPGAGNARRRA